MTRGTKRILAGAAMVCSFGWLVWFFVRDHDSLESRLEEYQSIRRLHQARSGPMDKLSLDYLRWNLRGRPSRDELKEARRELEAALVRHGYFEESEFHVPSERLDQSGQARLQVLISGGTYSNQWRSYRVHSDRGRIQVLACPGDTRELGRLIHQFIEEAPSTMPPPVAASIPVATDAGAIR